MNPMRHVLLFILLLLAAPAEAAAPFQWKQLNIVTSTGAGGTYDLEARLLARFMPKYLPGNPVIIVQNMPGGGNVTATSYMYNIAPKDGTYIATIQNGMPLDQAVNGQPRYDARKFNWLGSTGPENEVLLVWRNVGITSIQQAMTKEIIVGGTGAGSGIVIIPQAMNTVLGTKFKMVIGYKSSEEVNLAIERGEVQARLFGYGSIVSQHPDWLKSNKIAILAQVGEKRDRDLPNVPLITELAKTEAQRGLLRLLSAPPGLGHPYLAPPGVPADRVATLRQAFASTLHDKAFLAEAQKLQLEFDWTSADAVARNVRETIEAPPAVIAQVKAAMAAR